MGSWSVDERILIRDAVAKKESTKGNLEETLIAQLKARGHVQRSRDYVAQQIRNCKAWTVDLASTEDESDSDLGSPEFLRHGETFQTPSPRLRTHNMNQGNDSLREDELDHALDSMEKAFAARKERIMTLKRRYDTRLVGIQNKKAKMKEDARELEEMEEHFRRDTVELRKAFCEPVTVD